MKRGQENIYKTESNINEVGKDKEGKEYRKISGSNHCEIKYNVM